MQTRVDGEVLLVKEYFKNNKEDVNMENRRTENVANPENGADAVTLATLNDFKKKLFKIKS